jgi:5-methylcytosine-specific restriction endonuclease McrA
MYGSENTSSVTTHTGTKKNWQNVQVLVLNQNYEPMLVTNAKKAIILVICGKAEIIEKNSRLIRSISLALPMPSIVRLLRFVHVPRKRIVLSRRNVIKRDHQTCQYCGSKTGPFTVDHVIPKHRGGPDSWENLVCACVRCNTRKGGRSLEESNMRLLREPKKPSHIFVIQHFIGIDDQRWKPYLFLSE